MGQAFRRATGRIGSSAIESTPSKQLKKPPIHPTQRAVPADKLPPNGVAPPSEGESRVNREKVLEERDPQYHAMLSQMAGRIQSKRGGKLEMGEASLVEKSRRPMPKLRNTTPESSRYEEKPAPPGTLNVAQLRQIILLYQGKSDDHAGPMDIPQIAVHFRIDVAQVQRILQFVTLPPEDNSKRRDDQ